MPLHLAHSWRLRLMLVGGVCLVSAAALAVSLMRSSSRATEDQVQLNDSELTSLAESTSEQQMTLLNDGTVDWADYTAAFESYARCLQGGGATVKSTTVVPGRRIVAEISFPASLVADARVVDQQCYDSEFSVVDRIWSTSHPHSQDELSSAREALAACLRARGYSEVPEHPKPLELQEFWPTGSSPVAHSDFFACQAEVDSAFGLPGFGG